MLFFICRPALARPGRPCTWWRTRYVATIRRLWSGLHRGRELLEQAALAFEQAWNPFGNEAVAAWNHVGGSDAEPGPLR